MAKISQSLPQRAIELLSMSLDVEQRLDLIGLLWDSIPEEELPLLNWHRLELERRLVAADASPDTAISWEEVRTRLREK